MYVVYLLKCENYSYVGMTNDIFKRLRQHNGEIKGGAIYTSKRKGWYPVLIIDGFQDMKSAMQKVRNNNATFDLNMVQGTTSRTKTK